MIHPSNPIVSVVTPAFNCQAFLTSSIHSVVSQTFADWELLIVDDGSTDETLEIAQSAAERDRRIRVLRHPGYGNRGVSASRNLALRSSLGTYVAFLDADDEWLPHMLAHQVSALKKAPSTVLAFAKAQCVDMDGMPLNHPDWPHLDWTIGQAHSLGRIERGFGGFLSQSIRIPIVTSVAVRRTVLNIGGFTETLRYQVEDAILHARLCRAGAIHYSDKIVAQYRVHEDNFTASLSPLAEADSVWELQCELASGCDPPDKELAKSMLRCIDQYLTAETVPWRKRWQRAQTVCKYLRKNGIAAASQTHLQVAAAFPRLLKRRLAIAIRRRTKIGPASQKPRANPETR